MESDSALGMISDILSISVRGIVGGNGTIGQIFSYGFPDDLCNWSALVIRNGLQSVIRCRVKTNRGPGVHEFSRRSRNRLGAHHIEPP